MTLPTGGRKCCELRILIIDDHPMIVEAVTLAISSLRPEAKVQAAPSVEALDRMETEGAPQLILLDLTLPGRSGLAALATVRQRFPATAVVIFSATDDSHSIRNALDAGARGFIPKTSPHRVLIDALQLVLDGGTYIPPDILQGRPAVLPATEPYRPIVHSAPASGTRSVDHPQLSERQRQIVELLAQGMTTKEICRELNISPNTVKTHVASIFRALGVRNRAQVVAVTQAWLQRRTTLQ